jgi:hypothetical protein
MFDTLKNAVKFRVERFVLRGAHYRLLLIGVLIGLISTVGGLLAFSATTDFASPTEGIWWAFLRLTDPGYLGDDKGYVLATISTIVTVLGYVLFMGSLIAILTQWLDQTIRNLESGLTPIVQRNHLLILGWSNRTPTIVHELVLSEGRVRRFLQRHGTRKLRIVILSDEVTAKHRQDLRDLLGSDWDDRQIIFRSGTPLSIEHLRRVDFLNAAAVILPGSEIEWGGSDAADMRTIKALLSVSNMNDRRDRSDFPLMVAEVFDARKIPVARNAYEGKIEIIGSDSVISLLITQNVRHKSLSYVYSELLTHGEGSNEIYIRDCPALYDARLQDLREAFPKAILLGVLRSEGEEVFPMLNPPDGFVVDNRDRIVFIARSYQDTEPVPGYTPQPTKKGSHAGSREVTGRRRILLMGWNEKVPALISEFDSYENETFEVDVLSSIPIEERNQKMARYMLRPKRLQLTHLEGDYAAPSDLLRVDPKSYDNVVIVGCDWLGSKEEADARTILGLLLLKDMLKGEFRKPDVLLELLDPQNHAIFRREQEEVLISPMILSHMLAHVALRPDLNAVFREIFSSGGAEIFFRPAEAYDLVNREVNFRDVQDAVAMGGDTALGVHIHAESLSPSGGVYLNPDRGTTWNIRPQDEIVVLTAYV